MISELILNFDHEGLLALQYGGRETSRGPFQPPLSREERERLRWYLEVYSSQYTTEADDRIASQIEAHMPQWGHKLRQSLQVEPLAVDILREFEKGKGRRRVLTVAAHQSAIHTLPWELLTDTEGRFLCHHKLKVSVVRSLPTRIGSYINKPKKSIRILFVISRPENVEFIDSISEAEAVLEAVELGSRGQVTVEVLRPATLDNLMQRLEASALPQIDILHFDGHGVFDAKGRYGEQGRGFLIFEREGGRRHLVSAEDLGRALKGSQISLVVLSACQSAKMEERGEVFGTVATGVIALGVPYVLAMSYSVLVVTTRQFFRVFYRSLAIGKRVGACVEDGRSDLHSNALRKIRRRHRRLQDWLVPVIYQQGADRPLLIRRNRKKKKSRKKTATMQRVGHLRESSEDSFFGRFREIWDIESCFVRGTRRVSITGLDGIGKRSLAARAALWFQRSHLFGRTAFLDCTNTDHSSLDNIARATRLLSKTLGRSFSESIEIESFMSSVPVLLVLYNVYIASNEAFLDLVSSWSEAGKSRVLLTTNKLPSVEHRFFENGHYHLALTGLSQDAAISLAEYVLDCQPSSNIQRPSRELLAKVVEKVGCHPQAIKAVGRELRKRPAVEVLEVLNSAFEQEPKSGESHPLWPALTVAMGALDDEVRERLPQLGIFRGGSLEEIILKVTDLRNKKGFGDFSPIERMMRASLNGDVYELAAVLGFNREQADSVGMSELLRGRLPSNDKDRQSVIADIERIGAVKREGWWRKMRSILQETGLLVSIPLDEEVGEFLSFHPALTSIAISRLPQKEKEFLLDKYSHQYLLLVPKLVKLSSEKPRVFEKILRLEVANLLAAMRTAIDRAENWPTDGERVDYLLSGMLDLLKTHLDKGGYYSSAKEVTQLLEKVAPKMARQTSPIIQAGQRAYEHLYSGISSLAKGDYESAEIHIRHSIEKSKDAGDIAWNSKCYSLLALTRQLSGDIQGAMSWAQDALALARQHSDRGDLVDRLLHLGLVVLDNDDHDEAQRLAGEAQSIIVEAKLGEKRKNQLLNLMTQIALKKVLRERAKGK